METYKDILLHLIYLYDDIKNTDVGMAVKDLCLSNIDTMLGELANCITLDYIDKCLDQEIDCSKTDDLPYA